MKKMGLLLALGAICANTFAQFSFTQNCHHLIPGNAGDHMAIADFDNDGKNDVVVATGYSFGNSDYQLRIYHQHGGTLDSVPTIISYRNSYPGAEAIAAGDATGDQLDDIIVGVGDSIHIFAQTQGSQFTNWLRLYCGTDVDAIKLFDIDRDGKMDIVVSLWNSSYISIYFGEQGGQFSGYTYPSIAAGWDGIDAGILGNDTVVSILKSCGQGSNAPVQRIRIGSDRSYLGTVNYHFQTGQAPNSVAIGDWNGDGKKEFAVTYGGNTPTSYIAVWTNVDSTYTDTVLAVYDNPDALVSGDLDKDGTDEFIIAHGGWNSVSIQSIQNSEVSFFSSIPNYSTQDGIAVGDVTGDGYADIVTANTYGGLTVLANIPSISTTIGKIKEKGNNELILYPNPAHDHVFLRSDFIGPVVISDISGRIIRSFHKSDMEIEIPLSDMTPGMYFITVNNTTSKFIVR